MRPWLSIATPNTGPPRRGALRVPAEAVASMLWCSSARLCFVAGCVGWEDLVVTLLSVGDDGGWFLCWRRARMLCWLVLCVLTLGLPFR